MPNCLSIIKWKYLKMALIYSITQMKTVCKFPDFYVDK